ncbi:putative LPS assembly protein LptD [Bacteroidia bacterium]|nr:putative LPS assembly protein LptD [Bacteroidia bacterium]
MCTHFFAFSQTADSTITTDSDSSYVVTSLGADSIGFSIADHKSSLDATIEYEADDSIILDLPNKKAYLYGNAKIFYQNVKLNADYVVIDFDRKDVFATGIINDTTGKYVGRPGFEDAGKIYEADTMRYNFETKKGISFGVLTTEKDGYIHGDRVLRDSLENIYVKNARFTTCNLPEPHFYIKADKIKVIPKKQILTGPANLVIADINTPLFVPFGFFPIPEKRKKGILFPTFGESQERGFNLRGLGYYLPINDFIDIQATADIYFRGSWGATIKSNYYRKYKYRGNLQFSFNKNEFGEPESPSYKESNDYRLGWTFSRDAKAKPGRSFSANVNFVTSSFLKNNTTNYEDIISTNSNSSISYSRGFFNRKLNMSLNSNMTQNLSTGDLSMTLPQLTANVSRQMPFKKFNSKNKTARSFMRNLGISYQGTFKNQITTIDTVLVSGVGDIFGRNAAVGTPKLGDDFRNGVSHRIPISTSFKALKWITVSPNFNFSEYWYFKTTKKSWDYTDSSVFTNNNIGGFARAFSYSTSIGLSTILYGIKNFQKESKLQAIRHVVRPNISAVWNPDFSQGEKNGYREYIDSGNVAQSYSIYENALLGRPTAGPQGSLNFGLGNNLEIKILSAKDTANGGIKKVKIIESLNLSSGYNFLADSFHLSNFGISGNTTILNKIRMNFRTTFDPYSYNLDTSGTRTSRYGDFALNGMKKLGHFTSSSLSISTNLNPKAFKKKTSKNVNDNELEFINNNLQNYVDFNLPWSLSLNYNFRAKTPALLGKELNQSITFNGDIKLTENWKIGVSSGYEITKKELAFTSLEFFRDLHCWQMHFKWYPIQRQMFEFGINVKSSTLQDLKLNRRRSWFDF